jgi:hypothetical protein
MTTTAYLVSAAVGDRIDGVDIALLDGVQALKDTAAQSWMADQGYGIHDPSEVMYLCEEPPPAGWEFVAVELCDADTAWWRDVATGFIRCRRARRG